MQQQGIKKLYYSISEVGSITSLKSYVLRYWESEFAELQPGKNRSGNRIYKLDDIKTIFLIKRLLYDEKYTLEGARQKLRSLRKGNDSQLKLSLEDLQRDDAILEIRRVLKELLEFLDQAKNRNKEPPFVLLGSGKRKELTDSKLARDHDLVGADAATKQEHAKSESHSGDAMA